MPSRLYVGNLAYSVTSTDLESLFSQAGKVESVALITDKFSGQPKGFGFVEMSSSADAARAIEQFNDTELNGRNIKVNEARPRENRDSRGGGNGGGNRRGGGDRW
jgi:cold-inducible RNA-binding protein